MLARLLAFTALCLPTLALAARPFVTDDARLTSAGSCQLESWARAYPDSHEFWALPACNPGGNFELTAGGGRARAVDGQSSVDYLLQAKTLFKPLETNGWGWGLAFGRIYHPDVNPGPNLLGNTYVYVPISRSFADDQLVIHTNVGALKDRGSGSHRLTWGLGGELRLQPRLFAIAEAYGDDRSRPYWQFGGRLSLIPDVLQIDATIGQQVHGPAAGRWVSFGVRVTPEKLF